MGLVPRAADFPVYQESGGATRSEFVKKRPVFSQLRFKARDIGGLRRSRNRKRPIDKLGFQCYNGTISSFALIETDVSRLAAFVKWCLSCAILEGLRGTNGVADSVSSASCGRPATRPAAAAAQNFGALAVHSLNDQEICNATGNLARSPAPFSSDLPGYLSPATTGTKPIRLYQVWQPAPVEVNEDALPDRSAGQQGSAKRLSDPN